jgi:hypothetical protein
MARAVSPERFAGIFVLIFTVANTLLLLALFEGDPIEDFVIGGFTLASFETATANIPFDCMDPTERERVRDISLRGIDDGLKEAMQHLYTVWQKDPNTEQPKRARVGTVNAINAHARARKYALDWTPPTCPPEK